MSNCEDTEQRPNDDRLPVDDNEHQNTSVTLAQSAREKIKDIINVAHVSHLYSLEIDF